jgi:hypothetical protein
MARRTQDGASPPDTEHHAGGRSWTFDGGQVVRFTTRWITVPASKHPRNQTDPIRSSPLHIIDEGR